jgi:hypothetical protein
MQTTFETIKAVMTSNLTKAEIEKETVDNDILGRKLLIKMCNMLTVKMEMGGPMVAHYLLGGKGYYSNIKFKNLYWTPFVNYITAMEQLCKENTEVLDNEHILDDNVTDDEDEDVDTNISDYNFQKEHGPGIMTLRLF